MQRRRLLVLAVAVGAGAALLVFGRPGGDPAEQVAPPAAQPPAAQPPAAQPPAGPAAWPPPGQVPTGQPSAGPSVGPAAGQGQPGPGSQSPTSPTPLPVPPHDESGVTGGETLDSAAARQAVAAAERFAEIWASPAPDWQSRLAELATPALAAALAGADPPQPARQITGAGRVLFDAPAWARVGVPADRGTVVLDVVVVGDRWLVSAVDWWPA